MISECDGQPICISKHREDLRRLLLRAVNKNQILILLQIKENSTHTVTSLLTRMEKKFRISLSTLKLNAKILKELNLIKFGNFSSARLTGFGEFVLSIIGGSDNGLESRGR